MNLFLLNEHFKVSFQHIGIGLADFIFHTVKNSFFLSNFLCSTLRNKIIFNAANTEILFLINIFTI